MAVTAWKTPASAVNTADGLNPSWESPSNAQADDGSVALSQTGDDNEDLTIQLIKGGTAQGDNKADTATTWPSTLTKVTYGGAADLWGLTLTESDVEATNFGARVQARNPGVFGDTDSAFLDCTDYGFALPAGSTVDGVEMRVDRRNDTGNFDAEVDVVEMRVHYTESAAATATPVFSGGGSLASSLSGDHNTSPVASGGGGLTVAPSGDHNTSPAASGGGGMTATVSTTEPHTTSVTMSGGGGMAPTVQADHVIAAAISGGGRLTVVKLAEFGPPGLRRAPRVPYHPYHPALSNPPQ